jgi:hypothetical protein
MSFVIALLAPKKGLTRPKNLCSHATCETGANRNVCEPAALHPARPAEPKLGPAQIATQEPDPRTSAYGLAGRSGFSKSARSELLVPIPDDINNKRSGV